jgi:transposase
MGSFPGTNSVLILDNCKIHIGQTITNTVDKHQVLMIYLPSYSPNFNPIEKVFLCFKMRMKRDRQLTGHSCNGDLIEDCF